MSERAAKTQRKRILVTGGAGLIGGRLTAKLLDAGYDVVCFDLAEQFARQKTMFDGLRDRKSLSIEVGTIMDRTALIKAMTGVDAVFHLAAMLGVRRTEENRLRCLDINMGGTDNVLAACAVNRVDHVVVASSSEVYGEPSHNPLREVDETKGKTVYAVSKLAAEELTKGYAQLHPWLGFTIVRFFNTYGEGQVAQFVMSRFVKQVLTGTRPTVYGDGSQRRSYCHVDDTTDALRLILESPISRGKTYNIGNPGQVLSLRELATTVVETLAPQSGLEPEISQTFEGTDRTTEREIFNRWCDITLARTELGYDPKVTVPEGIRRIAAMGAIHEDWAHQF